MISGKIKFRNDYRFKRHTLSRHLNDLKENFIEKALNNNEMIIKLKEEVQEFLTGNPELITDWLH